MRLFAHQIVLKCPIHGGAHAAPAANVEICIRKLKSIMTKKYVLLAGSLGMLGLLFSASPSNAQNFTSSKGDLLAGFRKTGAFQGAFELVVNIGNVTNFLAKPQGSSNYIAIYAPSQLSAAFSSFSNLQWSVFGSFAGSTPYAGFPATTLWYTKARTDINIQSPPAPRNPSSGQTQARQQILGVGLGAAAISAGLGSTNANNNSVLVREPTGDQNALTAFIGGLADPAYGDFKGQIPTTAENTTPSSFTSPVRSDLYQVVPSGATDPNTGLTTGSAYYVGYFQLNPDGTMAFTRASNVAPLPPAPVLTITRSGNISTISFLSTNNVTYTLYFTNTPGLTAPVSTWP